MKAIKKLLIDRDMTITELALKTGFTRSHLSSVIHGRLDSRRAKRAIALALGVDFDQIWTPLEPDGTSKPDKTPEPRRNKA